VSGDTTISGALTPRTLRSAAAAIIIGLALIPLFVDLVGGRDDLDARFKRTVEADPDLRQRIIDANPRTWKEVLVQLPGRRIEGAHLAVDTKRHWIYAALSAIGFLVLAVVLFPGGRSGPMWPVLVAAFTGTVGVALLLMFQVFAAWSQEVATVNPIMLIVKMIGHSYRAAFDRNTGFMMSLAGFTFGVGLCEELLKSLPVFWHFRRRAAMDWRGALLWGIASGVGFGVAEGIFYSADFYNGLYGGTTYMVRFISCVALHSVWTAAVALTIWEDQEAIFHADSWLEIAGTLPGILFVPMVLHALYDTLLKRGPASLAIFVALASVAWLWRRLAVAREKERLDPAAA
jgi:RsiW-degrading membrane proteinase PrsW (M82 family)